jgi:TolA-binding protein
MINRYPLILTLVLAFMGICGCLRTRDQIRDGSPETTETQEVYQAPTVNSVQTSPPAAQYDIDEVKQEITRLQGHLEDLERKQKELEGSKADTSKEDDTIKKMEERLEKLEQNFNELNETLKKPSASGSFFDKGKTQFGSGHFDEAVELLSSYLRTPSPKKAEEATFLRAESYFKLKEYKKAIVDYSRFPEKYNRSSHLPMALYKIGLSFEALGMKDDAKGFYQEILDKYPKFSELKKVKAKLR